jgi:hypothetical protein
MAVRKRKKTACGVKTVKKAVYTKKSKKRTRKLKSGLFDKLLKYFK